MEKTRKQELQYLGGAILISDKIYFKMKTIKTKKDTI